jgi:hypothetical protein
MTAGISDPPQVKVDNIDVPKRTTDEIQTIFPYYEISQSTNSAVISVVINVEPKKKTQLDISMVHKIQNSFDDFDQITIRHNKQSGIKDKENSFTLKAPLNFEVFQKTGLDQASVADFGSVKYNTSHLEDQIIQLTKNIGGSQ